MSEKVETAPSESGDDEALKTHLNLRVCLFVHDRVLKIQCRQAFQALNFKNVSVIEVNSNYYQAARQLAPLLKADHELVLVNPPLTIS
ncbi:MAG: hypothetical protein JRJ59_05370, partial [Deltaproteobacteria bacterium]|nr:hypothetical protein [Deltaproteobacteria bacterium]